jgi:hypothetical protein
MNVYYDVNYSSVITVNYRVEINPLTPELNPSAQRCLTRYFTVEFASCPVQHMRAKPKNTPITHSVY